MSSDRRFVMNPTSLDRQRSVFNRNYQHKMSLEFGKLNLIGWDEVLPGDTFSTDLASVIRMGTPIAPIMDNIFCDYFAFFVPNRLVWDKWKEFNGESDSAWVDPNYNLIEPQILINYDYDDVYNGQAIEYVCEQIPETYLDQLGVPLQHIFTQEFSGIGVGTVSITALPLRGIQLIYNEFFRDENVIDKKIDLVYDSTDIYIGATDASGSDDFYFIEEGQTSLVTPIPGITSLFSVAKRYDVFTSALPAPQRGASVRLPLGTDAPVITKTGAGGLHDMGESLYLTHGSSAPSANSVVNVSSVGGVAYLSGTSSGSPSSSNDIRYSNLFTDLSKATAASVNQLRYAFATQRYLEAISRSGSRYIESLKGIYGVNAPNGLLQRPEYLGGKQVRINVDQVLSTADTSDAPVGQTGAYSLTTDKQSLFTKSFVEHGYVFIFAVLRQDHTYTQGINRMLKRKNLLDRYVPQLANIGEVPVEKDEIYCATSADKDVFGYNEAWYEYRFRQDYASGKLNPVNAGSLNYYTLADVFDSAPTLSEDFINENNNNLKRALVVGPDSGAPEFIADFYFKQKVAREMPLYSIPGLIDHH